jgi:hypothetical protein
VKKLISKYALIVLGQVIKGEIIMEEYNITLESIKDRVKNGRITVEEIEWLIAKVEENNKK